jgi:hypothetical protein
MVSFQKKNAGSGQVPSSGGGLLDNFKMLKEKLYKTWIN